jgi:endonuclease-3
MSTQHSAPSTPPSPEAAERLQAVLGRLAEEYPDAHCALNFSTPLELLVATILAAQCTDERVNSVTPALFQAYPTAAALAAADPADLEAAVRSTGFYRNKARNIQGACRRIVDTYGGEVPRTMDDLLTLPGVARKTANVVLSNAFGIAAGIAVDTHVTRLSGRLGLTAHSDPVKIEADLMASAPPEEWAALTHRFIDHGRAVCTAARPACGRCVLADLCPSAGRVG